MKTGKIRIGFQDGERVTLCNVVSWEIRDGFMRIDRKGKEGEITTHGMAVSNILSFSVEKETSDE